MTEIDPDHVSGEMVSLCQNCAKHREIADLVKSDLAEGLCGVCGKSPIEVFNPKRFGELQGLIRALIRFQFNEEDYNSHWGGTSVYDILLVEDNQLLEVSTCDEYVDDFMHRLDWEGGVYPAYEEGICLYAGHDEQAGRLVQFSIQETNCVPIRDIESRLRRDNFHKLEREMSSLLDRFISDIESTVAKNSLWFRSRTGVKDERLHLGENKVKKIAVPFQKGEIAALPPPAASAGRMNRQGVSVLYVANEVDTAIAEIRPHPGHLISVGGFRPSRDLKVVDFGVPISRFASSDARLDLFAIIYHFDELFSEPVTPEDRHKYAITQLLSDELIRRGYDGIKFRSSVGDGRNLCVFDPSLFEFDPSHSLVKRVDGLSYSFSSVATEA